MTREDLKGQDLKVRKTFLENRLNEKEIKLPCVTRKHQIGGRGDREVCNGRKKI